MDTCPVCKQTYEQYTPRYCNVVCRACLDTYLPGMTEPDGWKVIEFGNTGFGGGFMSVVDGIRTQPDIHKCYINKVPCDASEARFGGIVYTGSNVEKKTPTKSQDLDNNLPH